MPRLAAWAILFCLLASEPRAGAAAAAPPVDVSAAQARAGALGLARHPRWKLLLYYLSDEGDGEVLSPEYYFSPDGRASSQAELDATLVAWFAPAAGVEPSRCRFPARSHWLATALDLPPPPDARPCKVFDKWAKLSQLESVSMLMVSGYLGNPASSFGHSLIKFDYHTPEVGGGRLLDTSLSFGALIPEHEPMVRYVYRGLAGGYESGFSDQLYYARDQVYTRTQFRDIWEYRLALNDAERELLVMHLYELIGKKFTYYFLTENCAYRMAEVLTHATGEDYTPEAYLWFTPVEVFHLVNDRSNGYGTPLFDRVLFVPSAQRILYHEFRLLDADEAAAANRIIASEGALLESALAPLDPRARRRVLDTMTAYYEYRVASRDKAPDPELIALKDRVLRLRFALPSSTEPRVPVATLPAPTTRHGPFALSVGARDTDGEGGAYLGVTPYIQDLVDSPSNAIELVVGDLRLSVDGDGDVAMDQLDVIRVKRLQPNTIDIEGESRLSWNLRLGFRRRSFQEDDARPEVAGGLGRSTLLADEVLVYSMVDAVLRADAPTIRVEPEVGIAAHIGTTRVGLGLRPSYALAESSWDARWRFELRQPIERRFELGVVVEQVEETREVRLGLTRYW